MKPQLTFILRLKLFSLNLQVKVEVGEGQEKSVTENEHMAIPTSTSGQGTDSTQLTGLSQTNDDANFISLDTTQPVVMVTESVLHSMQDDEQGITRHEDNQVTAQDHQDNQLAAQDNQHNPGSQQIVAELEHSEQYTTGPPSPEISVTMETPQVVTVSMGTSEGLSVSMVAGSEDTEERTPEPENSLKVLEEEHSIQDYTAQTPCGETADNEPISMSLMFENGQQLAGEESPVVSHANVVPTVNDAPAVFTQ